MFKVKKKRTPFPKVPLKIIITLDSVTTLENFEIKRSICFRIASYIVSYFVTSNLKTIFKQNESA